MRIHTSLRTAFRLGLIASAFAGASLAATDASADVAGGSSNSSLGTAALRYEHTQSLGTSITTGWIQAVKILGVKAEFQASIKIDPVKDGGPLFIVDMPKGAIVEASWSNDKKITLKAQNGSTSDGQVKVRHSLSPDVDLKISHQQLLPNGVVFSYDATTLLNKIPGAKFDYDSQATQAFAPWGFTKVDTVLNAPLLSQSLLFSYTLSTTTGQNQNPLVGSIGLRAVTNPTFAYKTTSVTLQGGAPITASGGETIIDAIDGDYLEKTVMAEGAMDVSGEMDIEPVVTLYEALGLNVIPQQGISFSFDAYSKAYTVPTLPIKYQSVVVHIALPNVKAPKSNVNLGNVRPGGSASKTVTITNTGEKAAVLTMGSSNPEFATPTGQITIEPKGQYEATIDFSPSAAGPAEATITVLSNDPDSPEQTFKIGANGADVGVEPENTASGEGEAADSGCGCKTAGGTSNLPSWAGFGLLGLGALVLGRRRRGN